jgi:putative transposase
MARRNRYAPPGKPYHVVNRGNDRRVVFAQPAHYKVFLQLVNAGTRKFAVDLHAYCLMPNHFHLVLEPREDEALSAYMQWVTGCYSCHLRSSTKTVGHGHVFQRRFWDAPIRDDLHFLTVLRYVEANALRASLVTRAEDWQWSSLALRRQGKILSQRSELLPADWCELVNLLQLPEVLQRLRKEIAPKRGRPPGS